MIGSIGFHWRSLLAAVAGIAAGVLAAHLGVRSGASALIGWNVAAALYLIPTLRAVLFDSAETVRRRAGRQDESRVFIMAAILAAVGVSLAAIVLALHDAGGHGKSGHPMWILALSVATLVLSWLVVQSLFALHYAHRYFGDRDGDGTADEGLKFPGDPPQTYRDFLYVAICVGATCQVSDFNVTSARFRNLVTVHALIAFGFNTMVLALGINIFATVMGQ